MNTFRKDERLCSNKLIEKLFSEGKSFICYPLRISYCITKVESIHPAQVLIVVSKKRFKKAVDRNLIKRRIREAYRINKGRLYDFLNNKQLNMIISLAYVGKKTLEFSEIELQVRNMITKISNQL